MAELDLVARPGERASYSQAGYNLAGRIVEKVTGWTFERAVAALVLEPLGLRHSFFARDDVMTQRLVVGHNRDQDGTLSIARLWRRSRGDNPGGGIVSSAADQLRWAGSTSATAAHRAVPTSCRPSCGWRPGSSRIRAAADKELPPDIEPSDLGLLPGDGDEYVITSGALKGQRGFFTRDRGGAVVGIDLAGRFARRVPAASER